MLTHGVILNCLIFACLVASEISSSICMESIETLRVHFCQVGSSSTWLVLVLFETSSVITVDHCSSRYVLEIFLVW